MNNQITENEKKDLIIQIKNLTKKFSLESGFFARKDKFVYALNNVSFEIERGTTYGIVGESGSGKSTTAKIIVGMYKKDSGEIIFNSKNQFSENAKEKSSIKYIFQDPSKSLNPRMSIFTILTEGLKYTSKWKGKKEARKTAENIIEEVGLSKEDLDKVPSQFSGGQKQRIAIARALLNEPELLICDEVVSALDVSIQGQILNLLLELREKRNMTYLFIAHDLRVSCYFCDKIGVMYRGVLVEEGNAKDFYKNCLHPYTKLLFQGSSGKTEEKSGEIKTTLESINCCPFAHRCPKALEKCFEQIPEWKIIENGHKVRCFI